MIWKPQLINAINEGEKIARKYGNCLPIDPTSIAQRNQIYVQPKSVESSEGVSGMLLRHGDSFGIMYSTHIKSEGFQRFSIAHELGHYFLEGHIDHILSNKDSIHESFAGFHSNDSYEQEADYFASGLLMPNFLITPIIKNTDPGFLSIEKIAESCKTSLTSSAIRYTQLSKDAIAIIVSTKERVNFCFLSQAMSMLLNILWPRKHSPVPPDSLAMHFNKDSDFIKKGGYEKDEIDIREWLSGDKSIQFKEEIKGLGSYEKILTVLSCEEDIEEICNSDKET